MKKISLINPFFLLFSICLFHQILAEAKDKVYFYGDFSPSEDWTYPQEKPYRSDICLNGRWDFQPVAVPVSYVERSGEAPVLTMPEETAWQSTKIKIPSPWNVNDWGGGQKVGAGTDSPYAPSSVYFPSYPEKWANVRMGWLRRRFTVPEDWKTRRIMLHFDAVAGDCVVLINGKEAGRNFEQCLPFDLEVTGLIDYTKGNEILVGVRHCKLFNKEHPLYKHFNATYVPGSNTDKLVGIWQDVFLFAVPPVHVSDVYVKPLVDQDLLEVEAEVVNESSADAKIRLEGDVREWLNKAGQTVLEKPEIKWELGDPVLKIASESFAVLKPGDRKRITIHTKVGNALKFWTPDTPNLYGLILRVNGGEQTFDIKYTRFGWRQFLIKGNKFQLNGKNIQCFGDIQHPFGPYICSRRFAWAWYQTIKDFGGNAVRPHAQPWPKIYYDLADEMGLMVLDETGLFGSSISLNLEENITWERAAQHLEKLILRDRNHPSVVGWSAGNEMFAIALLNKPDSLVSRKWDDKLVKLSGIVPALDPTRPFITYDGDRDMDGRMPVWSKHFAHGLTLDRLPENLNKPLIVGESGATYYGKPGDLYQFAGDKAYESYEGRSEALAVDVYQNVVKMAKPFLSYYSPSEVCWFGLEHLNFGYSDFRRLPDQNDGIFAGNEYQENKPGYQFERIPPYVCTFNPGIDPNLPVYKPLPMYLALQAALKGTPSQWSSYTPFACPAKPVYPQAVYCSAYYPGSRRDTLAVRLSQLGIALESDLNKTDFLIINADSFPNISKKLQKKIRKKTTCGRCLVLILASGRTPDSSLDFLFEGGVSVVPHSATSLVCVSPEWKSYFDLPSLYFSEQTDNQIMRQGLEGPWVDCGEILLSASNVDWYLFNNNAENRKCAQIVLYEHLLKPGSPALVRSHCGTSSVVLSTLNYQTSSKEFNEFWRSLLSALQVKISDPADSRNPDIRIKEHNLLIDGPVNEK